MMRRTCRLRLGAALLMVGAACSWGRADMETVKRRLAAPLLKAVRLHLASLAHASGGHDQESGVLSLNHHHPHHLVVIGQVDAPNP